MSSTLAQLTQMVDRSIRACMTVLRVWVFFERTCHRVKNNSVVNSYTFLLPSFRAGAWSNKYITHFPHYLGHEVFTEECCLIVFEPVLSISWAFSTACACCLPVHSTALGLRPTITSIIDSSVQVFFL